MGKLTADFLLERLAENGVRRIYGYPGDGINAIIGPLERHKDKLEFVQVRHEELAAFMACAHGSVHSAPGYTRPRVIPPRGQVEKAAEILNSGKKVAMLVGQGALHATDEVIEVAEVLGAGIAKALLGKAAVPDDLPFVTGSIGLLGTKPSWTLMDECDTLLMVGSSFPYSEWLPKPGQARGIQIDLKGAMLNIRYPMELGLVGDAKGPLEGLVASLPREEG